MKSGWVVSPLILPNVDMLPIAHLPFNYISNYGLGCPNTPPSKRWVVAFLGVNKLFFREILVFKNSIKERVSILLQPSSLFSQESNIKSPWVSKSHTTLIPWITKPIPTYPCHFPFITLLSPPKNSSWCVLVQPVPPLL